MPLESKVVTPDKFKQYQNKHDDNYQDKLDRVAADIESGTINRLTLAIARQRYKCGDSVTRHLQVDLCKRGLLVKSGRRFAVAA